MANLFKCSPIALYLSLPVLLKSSLDKTTEMHVCIYANEASQSKPANMPTCRHESAPPISNV